MPKVLKRGVIAPLQKTVEKIAQLVGGPADGNLVAHVQTVIEERENWKAKYLIAVAERQTIAHKYEEVKAQLDGYGL